MCSLIGLAIALGMSTSDCPELAQSGYDEATATSATEVRLAKGETGYKITCNQETQLCVRRAEAICAGNYRMIDDPHRRPRAQAFIDGRIVTVNTDNPSTILVACDRPPTAK
jgi:hypothetical protein